MNLFCVHYLHPIEHPSDLFLIVLNRLFISFGLIHSFTKLLIESVESYREYIVKLRVKELVVGLISTRNNESTVISRLIKFKCFLCEIFTKGLDFNCFAIERKVAGPIEES